MTAVGVVHDPIFLEHRGPPGHPEEPGRLVACVEGLKAAGLWSILDPVPCRPITEEEAARIHDPAYFKFLLEQASGQSGLLDPDTYVSPASVDAARMAAGGTLDLVESVWRGRHASGVALVRPPGHHAERDRAMGFCLLGNVAIAAAAARDAGARVAIVDFDVHHGNGTQQAFERDPRVFFVSLHRYGLGFYPGTGGADEAGTGEGKGATLNIPLPAGAGNPEYLRALDLEVAPALQAFGPDLLLVSAGFDAHERDPLGGMALDDAGFEQIASRLAGIARSRCSGRWVAVLEGGYEHDALSRGVVAMVQCMVDESDRKRSEAGGALQFPSPAGSDARQP